MFMSYSCSYLSRQLDDDMLSMKELNKEVLSIVESKDKTDAKGDIVQLSFKTNKLLRKILLRRFQLEQDLDYITKMRGKIFDDEEPAEQATDHAQFFPTKGGIDKVINKLKTMIQDLDTNGVGKRKPGDVPVEGSTETKPGSSTIDGVDDIDSSDSFDQGDMATGVKVKVAKIKKVFVGDDDDSEMEEADLDDEEMEELGLEKRIRTATKKMEEIVKQQLRDSGVLPSGNKHKNSFPV